MSCRRPGFITCSICNATKYYSHVQRRFGQYSCEPCSKFMKRFLRDPKIFTCSHKGHCTIGKPSGEQEPRGVSVNRCKACWLKICLEKFILDSETRLAIDKYYAPKFARSSGSSPIAADSISTLTGGETEGPESSTIRSINTTSGNGSGVGGNGGNGSSNGREGNKKGGDLLDKLRFPSNGPVSGLGLNEGGTGKTFNRTNNLLDQRTESNNCDTTLQSPPPLPFPQRKRKPKSETTAATSTSSPSSSSAPATSSALSSTLTAFTTATRNLLNYKINSSSITSTGESIPLSTSLNGNSRQKEKHHHHHSHHNLHHHHHHSHHNQQPLHYSHQNSQFNPSSRHSDSRSRESPTFYGHPSTGGHHLLIEPLCLTTSGRRPDLSSSSLLGNLSSNSHLTSPSSSPFFPGTQTSLPHPSLGPRYPWSHRRKDDYDLTTSSLNSLTAILHGFRRELTRTTQDNLILRRGSEDDLNDLYPGDYSLTSSDLVLGGPYGGGSHIIKDLNGDGEVESNTVVMGSPKTPPPPPARCGKCNYCLPTIDEKANVVVVKENVGPVRCRLAEIMSKINQSSGDRIIESENIEGQISEVTVHSSIPTNPSSRRSRKERRSYSKGVTSGVGATGAGVGGGGTGVEREETETGTLGDEDDSMNNDDENDDRGEIRLTPTEGLAHRKRVVSGDESETQGISLKHHHHHSNSSTNDHSHRHPGSKTSSSSSSSSKLSKSVMFNNKHYKKILINEHFVNSTTIITPTPNSQATYSNSIASSSLTSRDLTGPVIGPDSNFLSEILNANSPFL